MKLLVVVMCLAACGDNAAKQPDASVQSDAPKPIDAAIDAPPPDAGPRGPNVFALPGVAYGLRWDATASTLYITDDTNHRLSKFTDANGIQAFGAFTPTGTTLGQIVELPDNTFLVPNQAGGILTMSADGTTNGAVAGLDATRRRVGITLDPAGTLYEAFFVGNMAGMQTGGVASVAIDNTGTATETPITTSVALKKVTGIAATATNLFVCDTTASKIYSIVIATGATTTFASPPSCDLIYALPNGDLATGGVTGGLYRVTSAGVVSTIHSGFEQARGIAYDSTMKRMFVIEHRATLPTMPRLWVFPLDN